MRCSRNSSRIGGARGGGQREGQRARRVAVDAVHHPDVGLPRPEMADVVLDARERGVLADRVGRGGHGQQAGGLVHDQDRVVLVQDGERDPRPAEGGLAVRIQHEGRARADGAARVPDGHAVHAHLSLLDDFSRFPARQPRMKLYQGQVESHDRFLFTILSPRPRPRGPARSTRRGWRRPRGAAARSSSGISKKASTATARNSTGVLRAVGIDARTCRGAGGPSPSPPARPTPGWRARPGRPGSRRSAAGRSVTPSERCANSWRPTW